MNPLSVNRRDFLVGGACAMAAGSAWADDAAGAMSIRVTDDVQGALPEWGLGFSAEKHLIGKENFFVPGNASFVGCCKRLGRGVLRMGGTHVEHDHFDPQGPGHVEGRTSPRDMEEFAAFVKRIGWKVVYGINLGTSTPEVAAAEAKLITELLGPNLLAFELGNEPNLFVQKGTRERGYTYEQFLREWESFAAAVKAAVPTAVLSGPGAFSGWEGWTLPFARDEKKRIELLTGHYYTASGRDPKSTMEMLFDKMPELFAHLKASVKAAKDNGIPMGFRMIESNSFVGGGLPKVSDRMAAALWGLEYLLTAGSLGVNGVNFQIGPTGQSNTPLQMDFAAHEVNGVQPLFYAMAVVAAMGTGPMLRCEVQGKPAPVAVFAHRPGGGGTSVVVVNKSETAMRATIEAPAGMGAATAVRMESDGLLGQKVRLNGTEIRVNGEGTPKPETVPVNGRKAEFSVAAASAVWINFKA